MGVHGLWSLLQSTGRPVTLESLEGKVLAVDISIWLNQMVKGMRDRQGNTVANAHLVGLFTRICKLLYYRIKPVFVFDGGVPALKKHTLAARRQQKEEAKLASAKTNKKLLETILKQQAVRTVLSADGKVSNPGVEPGVNATIPATGAPDMFELPPIPEVEQPLDQESVLPRMSDDSDSEVEEPVIVDVAQHYDFFEDPEEVDTTTEDFKSLPGEIQHEILTSIKEARKRTRTRQHIASLPKDSDTFSSFQLGKLLKQNALSQDIAAVRKQMVVTATGDVTAGLVTNGDLGPQMDSRRVVSDDNTRYILLKGLRGTQASQDSTPSSSQESLKGPLDGIAVGITERTSRNDLGKISNVLEKKKLPTKMVAPPQEVCLSEDEDDDDDDDDVAILDKPEETPAEKNSAQEGGFILDEVVEEPSSQGDSASTSSNKRPLSSPDYNDSDKRLKTDNSAILIDDSEPILIVDRETGEVSEASKDEEEEDDDFLEVVINTNNLRPHDDIFPAAIFEKPETEKPETEKTETDNPKENGSPDVSEAGNVSPVNDAGIPVVIDSEEEAVNKEESDFSASSRDVQVDEDFDGITQEELLDMQVTLEKEGRDLRSQQGQQERVGASITDQMYTEAQELLTLFGLPFVLSPMEAESQCAYLDVIGLTDGVVTDDSDVWLFGGRRVYKNFFNQNKTIEFYNIDDIQTQLLLDRERLSQLALLCGSDYTSGIEGVGPVTGLEILELYAGLQGLRDLKTWWDTAHKQPRAPLGETKIKNKLRKLHIHDGFPSAAVIDAYLKPAIDESTETFSWGKPDLDLIRDYSSSKLGWTRSKTDEILLPVMKQLSQTQVQTRINSYFMKDNTEEPQKPQSKRVKNTLARMRSSKPSATTSKGKGSRGGRAKSTGKAPKNTAVQGGGWISASSQSAAVREVDLSESSSGSEKVDDGFDSSGDELLAAIDLNEIDRNAGIPAPEPVKPVSKRKIASTRKPPKRQSKKNTQAKAKKAPPKRTVQTVVLSKSDESSSS